MVWDMFIMLPILDSRVERYETKWKAVCKCGKASLFSTKASALRMLKKENCRYCKVHYSNILSNVDIYKNSDGKWCSRCSCCGIEQAYTRKDHAKQSQLSDWQCKKCVAKSKGFSENLSIGNERRLYNRFRKLANTRGIEWDIDYKDFIGCYTGKCALSGWQLNMNYGECTASLDRIDSSKGYKVGNIQWVHIMVNMCKNKYPQDKFIEMCNAISSRVKW